MPQCFCDAGDRLSAGHAALGKASAYLQMIERETQNDVDEQNNSTDVVGIPDGEWKSLVCLTWKITYKSRNSSISSQLVNGTALCKNDSSPLHQSTCNCL